LYQIGETYYFAKEFEKAISEYGNYAKKYPKGQFAARAVYMQANCYVTLQEWGEAKKKFLDIVNDYPNFDEMCVAKNYLAFSLRRLDDKKGARKYYEQVIKSGHCSGEPLKFAKEQREGLLTEQ
jgi:TolA-binding protein